MVAQTLNAISESHKTTYTKDEGEHDGKTDTDMNDLGKGRAAAVPERA